MTTISFYKSEMEFLMTTFQSALRSYASFILVAMVVLGQCATLRSQSVTAGGFSSVAKIVIRQPHEKLARVALITSIADSLARYRLTRQVD